VRIEEESHQSTATATALLLATNKICFHFGPTIHVILGSILRIEKLRISPFSSKKKNKDNSLIPLPMTTSKNQLIYAVVAMIYTDCNIYGTQKQMHLAICRWHLNIVEKILKMHFILIFILCSNLMFFKNVIFIFSNMIQQFGSVTIDKTQSQMSNIKNKMEKKF
jgi:hypothetical protein